MKLDRFCGVTAGLGIKHPMGRTPSWVLPRHWRDTGGRKVCLVSSHRTPRKAHACSARCTRAHAL